jgi:hypothetical protein
MKFIEIVDTKGHKILINTRHIVDVKKMLHSGTSESKYYLNTTLKKYIIDDENFKDLIRTLKHYNQL